MIFLGQTETGRRWHVGNWISPRHTSRETWVYTFCGSEMKTWTEVDMPPREHVDGLCKTCFRQYAWELMVQDLADGVPMVPLSRVYDKQVKPSLRLVQEHAISA